MKLEVMEREGHIGFCCAKCSGVLLTETYVATLQFKPEDSALNFYAVLGLDLTNVSKCKCPACNNKMHIAIYKNVEVDFCGECKSVWFDFNELCSALTSHKSNKVGSPTHTKNDIASAIAEFFGGLLSNLK
ncbi:Zn-finger nucleic acid-binding protein [Cellvibrio fibrivorans]|uniref:Zn-finger nucleic acid-binding protein n=1 Tax=Cellvibrio fibrivorans TaxID=126350 RepID=A0ABU1V432_9GAMM|nr:Zn-finger nucleic acid-binding protein [Cellvibrio fibrivorans]